MGQCEVCKKYGETTEVTITDKSTGQSRDMDMCPECAVRAAAAIKAGGGEVVWVDGSRGSSGSKGSSGGCSSVFLIALAAASALGYLLLA